MKKHFRLTHLGKILSRIGLVMVLFYLLTLLYHYYPIFESFDPSAGFRDLLKNVSEATPPNFVILIILTALGSAVPFMSNAVLAILNGVVFGPLFGLGMNLLANTLGNCLARWLLGKISIEREEKLLQQLEHIPKSKSPMLAIIMGYMFPFVPTLAVNYYVSITNIPWKKWLPCVLIGVFPTSLIYALGGHVLILGQLKWLIVIGVILVLGLIIFKWSESRKKS